MNSVRDQLMDFVLIQLQNDLESGDLTRVVELLEPLRDEQLMNYLSDEEKQEE